MPNTSSCTASQLRFDTLSEWLAWQESLHGIEIELGLDRCRQVAANMGLLNPDYKVISVAGTNGKGSSVMMLDTILQNSGYTTGCYTSPHLVRYNERVRINGAEVSDADLCQAFERINTARGDISLTYFEFGTLAALELFRDAGVEVAVLEVGLGGRLDAVNILDADVALVTAIGIDHQNYLGDTRELIAVEKAGIFRAGRPAICSDPNPPQSLIDYATGVDARLLLTSRDFMAERGDGGWHWSGRDSNGQTHDWPGLPDPDRFNSCQVQNAAGVLMALQQLKGDRPIELTAVMAGLSAFRLTGRFQVLPGEVQYILDVAHNEQAAMLLLENLKRVPAAGRTHVVIGMLRDKDRPSVFRALNPVADAWHTVSICNSRGTDADTLAVELHTLGVTQKVSAHSTMAAALAAVRENAQIGDRVLITGSFLTVGAALKVLEARN
ncbi:MAG: bifunctional tetrahydrofolate synthase/dihydrofolate synthase [Gammaproteobacteria bacterium]